MKKKDDRSCYITSDQYNSILEEYKEAKLLKDESKSISTKQYRRLKRYNCTLMDDKEYLTDKTGKLFCKSENLYAVLIKY